jgi:hypothetical protein
MAGNQGRNRADTGRYEDYVYLDMLEREWKPPVVIEQIQTLAGTPPSPRAGIVLLYWSYFGTRIDRLLRSGLRNAPSSLIEDSLERYSSIGSRLDRFYRVVFNST